MTGQNDQSPSGIHNYYSTQRTRDIKSRGEGGKGGDRCSEVNSTGEIKAPLSLSSAVHHPGHFRPPFSLVFPLPSVSLFLSGLIVCVFSSQILSLSLTRPSILYLKGSLSIKEIKVEWSVYSTISLPNSFPPCLCI